MTVPVISSFAREERRVVADPNLRKRVQQQSEQPTRKEELARLEGPNRLRP